MRPLWQYIGERPLAILPEYDMQKWVERKIGNETVRTVGGTETVPAGEIRKYDPNLQNSVEIRWPNRITVVNPDDTMDQDLAALLRIKDRGHELQPSPEPHGSDELSPLTGKPIGTCPIEGHYDCPELA